MGKICHNFDGKGDANEIKGSIMINNLRYEGKNTKSEGEEKEDTAAVTVSPEAAPVVEKQGDITITI